MTDHERLHQRLHDGTADAGMYPDCAREMGMMAEPTDEQRCYPHPYHGDDGVLGRCYCGEVTYPRGGPPAN